jgi:glycosyltransferase involved in cell wall biosynthesis
MKFSVAMCTYNGEKYVEQQLMSILQQSLPVDEIIICDDSSKDHTVAIADRILKEHSIPYRIVVNTPALGVSNNFLKALKLTTGDYVFTCDQDDVWYEDKVQIFADAIAQSGKDLYFSDGILVDGECNPLGSTLWQALTITGELADCPCLFHRLLNHPMVTGAAMAVSRKLIDRVSAIPENWLHDEWFSIVAALKDSATPILRPTFFYRQHGHNVVGAKKRNLFQKIDFWLQLIKKLKPLRQEHFQKKCAILEIAAGTPYEQRAKDARDFWGALHQMADANFFTKLRTIFRMNRMGYYDMFYTGKRGLLRDILSCFIR